MYWIVYTLSTVDHFQVPAERQGIECGNWLNHSCCRQNVRMTCMHSSVSQVECLAVEKIGFCRSSPFLAGMFKSSCKESIPYVSGGVLFLGHSLYFPLSPLPKARSNPVWDIYDTHHKSLTQQQDPL